MDEAREKDDARRERVIRHQLAEPERCRSRGRRDQSLYAEAARKGARLTTKALRPDCLDVVDAEGEQDGDHDAEPPASRVATVKLVDEQLDALADVHHSDVCEEPYRSAFRAIELKDLTRLTKSECGARHVRHEAGIVAHVKDGNPPVHDCTPAAAR